MRLLFCCGVIILLTSCANVQWSIDFPPVNIEFKTSENCFISRLPESNNYTSESAYEIARGLGVVSYPGALCYSARNSEYILVIVRDQNDASEDYLAYNIDASNRKAVFLFRLENDDPGYSFFSLDKQRLGWLKTDSFCTIDISSGAIIDSMDNIHLSNYPEEFWFDDDSKLIFVNCGAQYYAAEDELLQEKYYSFDIINYYTHSLIISLPGSILQSKWQYRNDMTLIGNSDGVYVFNHQSGKSEKLNIMDDDSIINNDSNLIKYTYYINSEIILISYYCRKINFIGRLLFGHGSYESYSYYVAKVNSDTSVSIIHSLNHYPFQRNILFESAVIMHR